MNQSSMVIAVSDKKIDPFDDGTISLTQMGFVERFSSAKNITFKDIQPHPKGVVRAKIKRKRGTYYGMTK